MTTADKGVEAVVDGVKFSECAEKNAVGNFEIFENVFESFEILENAVEGLEISENVVRNAVENADENAVKNAAKNADENVDKLKFFDGAKVNVGGLEFSERVDEDE